MTPQDKILRLQSEYDLAQVSVEMFIFSSQAGSKVSNMERLGLLYNSVPLPVSIPASHEGRDGAVLGPLGGIVLAVNPMKIISCSTMLKTWNGNKSGIFFPVLWPKTIFTLNVFDLFEDNAAWQ